jgi:hypothetical protein
MLRDFGSTVALTVLSLFLILGVALLGDPLRPEQAAYYC